MGKSIVIMAGGTGGHVFPALAVALVLREQGWQVSWLGTHKGLESRVVPENGIAIDWLPVAGVRGKGLFAKIKAVLLLFKACAEARMVLRRRKPDVVLGMGGFVSGPGGLMAKQLGIPLVIHEQNRIPGTTNRLLAKIAQRVLEAFPDSFNKQVKAQCTGNPLRKNFVEQTGIVVEKSAHCGLNVLVIGGSQGAQVLNEILPDALAQIEDAVVKHQTGAVMQEQVALRYQALAVDADVQAFIGDMVAVYQWADLVICRAGAMTVSEVAAIGVPAIFVPLPDAIDDHQNANARFLSEAGAAVIVQQKDLHITNVVAQVNLVRGQLPAMSQAAKQCARLDATAVVAKICMMEAGL
jgi:UDP-N-acetylglucosamine--N-acetylmuramyl-(pentapeptide) pyrophosphoryl-undecaprenol N-acetylglucosamine transferase